MAGANNEALARQPTLIVRLKVPSLYAVSKPSLIVKLQIPSLSNGNLIDSTTKPRDTSGSRQPPRMMKRVASDSVESDAQQQKPRKRVKFAEATDANTAVDVEERDNEDGSMSEGDSVDSWPISKVASIKQLFQSGKTNDELLDLASTELRGVNLLQLRLYYTMQGLLEAFESRHDGEELQQSTIKKAFTNAFNDAAEQSGMAVDDIKRVYNHFTQGSRTRKMRGTLQVASEPASTASRPPRATVREATPAMPPPRKEKAPRKKPTKGESASTSGISTASPIPRKPADEIAAKERLAQLRATGLEVPELHLTHSLVRFLSEKQKFEGLNTDQLREIDHVGRVYAVDELVLSINCWYPDCATEEEVSELVAKCREEMVLPGPMDFD